jgi:hypothetical protein
MRCLPWGCLFSALLHSVTATSGVLHQDNFSLNVHLIRKPLFQVCALNMSVDSGHDKVTTSFPCITPMWAHKKPYVHLFYIIFLSCKFGHVLQAARVPNRYDVNILQLHRSLDKNLQDSALSWSPDMRRRIILTTSIAETSLSVPGVRTVVDFGMDRRPAYDMDSEGDILQTVGSTSGHCQQSW